jgi:hypothetical protein
MNPNLQAPQLTTTEDNDKNQDTSYLSNEYIDKQQDSVRVAQDSPFFHEGDSQSSPVKVPLGAKHKLVKKHPSNNFPSLVHLKLPIENQSVHQNSFKGVISTRRSQASQGISSNKSTVPIS